MQALNELMTVILCAAGLALSITPDYVYVKAFHFLAAQFSSS